MLERMGALSGFAPLDFPQMGSSAKFGTRGSKRKKAKEGASNKHPIKDKDPRKVYKKLEVPLKLGRGMFQ